MSPTTIPARHGSHTLLSPTQKIRITNPSGTQVVDLWAFPLSSQTPKWLSAAQSRQKLSTISPTVGDTLIDTHRNPLLTLVEDTSPGIHDILYPGCDEPRYSEAGVADHASCVGNLKEELGKFVKGIEGERGSEGTGGGLVELEAKMREWGWAPEPFNLFMNVPVTSGNGEGKERGRVSVSRPVCKRGDYVVLRAEVECLVVMSACPNDLLDTNGGRPSEAVFEVLD